MCDAVEECALDNGSVVKIYYDDAVESPREWDNLGIMACFHNRYMIGDKDHGINGDDFESWDEMEEYIWNELDAVVILPIYLYNHSGLAFNTTGFSCPWDSGQIGFIFTTKQKIKEFYGDVEITDEFKEKLENHLRSEIEVYEQYATGQVYYYVIYDKDGELTDSCGGFYGIDTIKEELGIKE